jgi:HSP20 family protein
MVRSTISVDDEVSMEIPTNTLVLRGERKPKAAV